MKMHNTRTLAAPADVAWQVIGERFGDLSWTSSIAHVDLQLLDDVVGEGATRVCTSSKGFGPFAAPVLHEKLVHFDRDAMALTYVVTEGLPPLIRKAENAWRVVAVDDVTCRVESTATSTLAFWIRPLGPLLARAVNADLQNVFDELAAAIEAAAVGSTTSTTSCQDAA